jgi:S-adenosylmethionine/arginine decarboxylase-like enzyme
MQQTTMSSAMYLQPDKSVIHSHWIQYHDHGRDKCTSENSCAIEEKEEDTQISKHDYKGMHLLMDIEYVDSDFLNSEERLSNAMVDLAKQIGLTLLSYHCHGLSPNGVSCAGVLLEGHIAFHTWPKDGVIALDLFAFGNETLLSFVPSVEKLFGIPQADGAGQEPHSVWAHKLRGFEGLNDDDEDDNNNINGGESEATDFFGFPIGRMTDFKQKVRLCVHVSISIHQYNLRKISMIYLHVI